ncbi:MAG: DUF664 domain-containing protein [bacterium]
MLFTLERRQRSREVLRGLLRRLTHDQITQSFDWCGCETIALTCVHVVGCELLWVQGVLRGRGQNGKPGFRGPHGMVPVKPGWIYSPQNGYAGDLERTWELQDALAADTARYAAETDLWADIECSFPWQPDAREIMKPWLVLNHVFSHEFHHKGQIVGMVRALGITDIPETDLA